MNKAAERKYFFKLIIQTTLLFGIAIFTMVRANAEGFENYHMYHIINVTFDVFGMLVGCILLIGISGDKRKNVSAAKYLYMLVIVIYIALFTDAMEYIYDALPQYKDINKIINTIYYIMLPAEAVCFWHYTINYLNIRNRKVIIVNYLITVGFLLSVLIRIANIKYGFYFILNEKGIYERGPYYLLSKVFFLLVMILSLYVITKRRRQFSAIKLMAAYLYALAPIAIGITSIFASGLSLTPITTIVLALFMYCILNVSQNRDIAVADKEYSIASSVQENVLPKTFPYLPNRKEFDLFAIMKPAKEVGGDFYDFFMVDDDHLALVIADVSGKGIPAALFMMTSRILIKNRVQAGDSLSDILADVNNQLCEGNVADLFVTVWIGIIDLTTGHCVEVNAGHEYPIIGRAGGKYEVVLSKHDIAVAMFEDQNFTEHEFTLNPGDSIFVYTDGVTEAMNPDDEIFTKERLVDILNNHPGASPKEVIDIVLQAIDTFTAGAEQFDDTTMLYLKYNGA